MSIVRFETWQIVCDGRECNNAGMMADSEAEAVKNAIAAGFLIANVTNTVALCRLCKTHREHQCPPPTATSG